jgi:hypothetical protein
MNITRTSLPLAPSPAREVPRTQRSGESAPGTQAAAAPQGEASLWDVLTPEEREFFTQQAALGTLRYGPRRNSEPPQAAPRGQRLDVRG